MIGLCDIDLYQKSSTGLYVPNLEIMKLATYYKLEEKTFCQLISPEETELGIYDKVFLFSEQDNIIIPDAFKRAKNVIYGGTAFTKGIYIPFKNEVIDYTLPRTFIYKNFLSEKYSAGVKSKEINHFLDNGYYRIYAGENKLPAPAIAKKKKIYIYDREFFYPDWKETLTLLSEKIPSTIIRIHPITCTKLNDFFEIRKLSRFSRGNEIVLDLNIPYEEIPILFGKYEKRFLADINNSSNVYIPLGKTLNSNQKYFEDLKYSLNLLYSFWSKNITIKIKFIKPNLGNYNPLINLSELIESWASLSTEAKKKTTILSRIKKNSLEEEQYNLFLSYSPKSKDLFEQTFNDLKERRYWRL